MSSEPRDYIDDLNDLPAEARTALDEWLVLRHLELRGFIRTPIRDEDLRERIAKLCEGGDVESCSARYLFVAKRPAVRLSAAGLRRLAEKREQVEQLHTDIGCAIAGAEQQLADLGVLPGVLLLERMILIHHRFDRQGSGFFTNCESLRAHVRGFSSSSSGSADAAMLTIGLSQGLDL